MTSALDNVNVSRLLSTIRRPLAQTLEHNMFETNDKTTRQAIEEQVIDYLYTLPNSISSFTVVCNEANNPQSKIDNNELHVDIMLKPIGFDREIILAACVTVEPAKVEAPKEPWPYEWDPYYFGEPDIEEPKKIITINQTLKPTSAIPTALPWTSLPNNKPITTND